MRHVVTALPFVRALVVAIFARRERRPLRAMKHWVPPLAKLRSSLHVSGERHRDGQLRGLRVVPVAILARCERRAPGPPQVGICLFAAPSGDKHAVDAVRSGRTPAWRGWPRCRARASRSQQLVGAFNFLFAFSFAFFFSFDFDIAGNKEHSEEAQYVRQGQQC